MMRINFTRILMSCFFLLAGLFNIKAQEQKIPLVYDVEHTGAHFPLPVLPSFNDLPVVNPLTDPFLWSDGSGRDTTFASWSQRRAEIKAEIEHYEIGLKPTRPDTLTASYQGGVLTVNITVKGSTLTLTSNITLPAGEGPFPALIGMGGGAGSLPADIFTSRKIALVPFNFSQVMAHTQTRGSEPINKLYPELVHMGAYSAWSWGVSRLIDGLELVKDELPIDLKHLGVTGCSFAGKMALFAGAFDERIALTIAQESGGGGAAAWRVSETVGEVETLGRTSNAWFMQSMFQFAGNNVPKLPHDHHELMAMVAPRALLVLGNPDYVWLADESGYVSCRAAHEVWKNFGIEKRFGFSIIGGHGHCQLPASQRPEVEAFVDAYLLGDLSKDTLITKSIYDQVNYKRWYQWWGEDESYFPEQFIGETYTYEAECAAMGADWIKASDNEASNGACVVSKEGRRNTRLEGITDTTVIHFPFTVDSTATFTIYARINCPTSDNDSFWAKMDNENFSTRLSMGTNGWEWKKFGEYRLEKGDHTFSIAYRESGGQIDKISFSSYLLYVPTELGNAAENVCDPRVGINLNEVKDGFFLGQNYPNPVNGFTQIPFVLPEDTFVSLKVFDIRGAEVATLVNAPLSEGKHTLNFDTSNLSQGIYFYSLKTDRYSAQKKMILQKR